jgi:ribosomal protein S7
VKQHINISVDTKVNVHTILNRYNNMRHSLFNYWSLLFYNKYLYYFFNCFFKQGKKQVAIKIVYFLLYTLKKKTMISPILILQAALLNYRHILKLKVIKYRRKKIFSYLLLSLNKQVKVSIKYLSKQFKSFNISNKYSLVERLSIFILNLFFRTPLIFGRFLQHSAQVHKLIEDNRKVFKKTKFKKFKRKRFKKKFNFRWRRRRPFIFKKRKRSFSIVSNKNKFKLRTKINLKGKYINKWKSNKKEKLNLKKKINLKKKNKLLLLKKVRKNKILKFKRLLRLRKQRLIIKRKLMLKRKKRMNLRIVKRKIRKVLVRSFIRPLKRKRYKLKKHKFTEFNQTVKHLYTDTNTNIDFDVLNEIQTMNTFFINSIPKNSVRKFFFYILLGRWYKLLERTYHYLTTPFWHLYNLRTNVLRHKLYSKPVVQELVPHIQTKYITLLIKYIVNPTVRDIKLDNIKGKSNYNADPLLFSTLYNIYRRKHSVKSHLKTKLTLTYSRTKKTSTNAYKLVGNNIDLNPMYKFLRRKSLRKFFKNKLLSKYKIRKRIKKIITSFYAQRLLRIQRRKYTSFVHILTRVRRYFYAMIRFRLVRMIWRALRAVSFRQTRPLNRISRKIIANRAFLIKN